MCNPSFVDIVNSTLEKVNACISQGTITFVQSGKEREKNLNFIQTYSLGSNDRLKIIKELTKENLCQVMTERVKDPKIYEDLFVFGIEKKLIEKATGIEKEVQIYIKLQLCKLKGQNKSTLVISFHEAENKLSYFNW